MLRYARQNEIPAINISVDLEEPGLATAFDGHPSTRATTRYADKLSRFMRKSGLLTTEINSR